MLPTEDNSSPGEAATDRLEQHNVAALDLVRAHREIERVAIDELEGRITSILLTPYPPGIPLLIPGERFNKTIVDYLRFARDFNERFPGFETDVHGLVKREVDGKRGYFVDCVKLDENA